MISVIDISVNKWIGNCQYNEKISTIAFPKQTKMGLISAMFLYTHINIVHSKKGFGQYSLQFERLHIFVMIITTINIAERCFLYLIL